MNDLGGVTFDGNLSLSLVYVFLLRSRTNVSSEYGKCGRRVGTFLPNYI